METAPRTPASRPNLVSVGTIIWLSSELMFFAALFAMYFTVRSVTKGSGLPWPGAHLNLTLGAINTTVLLLSSVTCQMGVFAVERGQISRTRSLLHPMSWGLREWYVLTFLMGLYFDLGQGYEYLDLVREEHLTLASSAYGSVFYIPTGFHGLHVTGGLIAFIFLLGRTYAAQAPSPMNNRSARSSCRTTGTSSTSCGSACSPSSTSSTSPGDERVSWINARRRRPAAGYAALLLGLVVVALVYGSLTSRGGGTEASAAVGAQQDITAGQGAVPGELLELPRPRGPGHLAGPQPDRLGRGRGLLPDVHRPHAGQGSRRGEQPQAGDVHHRSRSTTSPAYVASLGGGPAIPTAEQVDPAKGGPRRSARSCSAPTARSATTSPGRAAR